MWWSCLLSFPFSFLLLLSLNFHVTKILYYYGLFLDLKWFDTHAHKKTLKTQFWIIRKENKRLLLILVWVTGVNDLFLNEYKGGCKEPLSWKFHPEQAHQKQKAFPSSLLVLGVINKKRPPGKKITQVCISILCLSILELVLGVSA